MRPLLRFLCLAPCAVLGGVAASEPTDGEARMLSHAITIRLEPSTGRFVAKDVVTFDTSAGRGFAVDSRFVRRPALLEREAGVGHGRVPDGATTVEFVLAGELREPVRKKAELAWVAGDETAGVISEKGAYLSGASGWYARPFTPKPAPAKFDVVSYVPEPYLVVTQGGVPERSTVVFPAGWTSESEIAPPETSGESGTRYAVATAKAAIPTEDCSLSAGPYKTATRTTNGVTLSTYFYEPEAADAPLWLDAAEEVAKRYDGLLPPYPHPKFDVVANFFASGYGMPSYTLLGDEVIRYVTSGAKRSKGKIPPGYLDHEYVHGWFGNGLLVDPADGNWCEALTTYYSNYYAKELESPDAAREHRRGVLEHYAIRVQPDEDYPVREFRSKTEDKDNDVGYGKGSMIFHMLRRRLGDERFFAAVRELTAKRVGTFVSWKDWLHALDGEWVRPWLERKGLPELRLSSVTAWKTEDGKPRGRFEVRQVLPRGEAPYPKLQVAFDAPPQSRGTFLLEGDSHVFRSPPTHDYPVVEIDPDYDVLRRIAPEDLPYCLNRTLEERGGRVRSQGADAVFGPLSQRLAGAAKWEVLPAGSAAPQDGKPLISLVVAATDEVRKWPKDSDAPVVLASPEKIVVKGKEYVGPQFALLFSHPAEHGSRTTFYALSEQAAARAGYMTYYGWDQYVVFENGRPVDRGFLDGIPKGTRREAMRGDDSAARIEATIAQLSSSELAGRFPGTEGHAQAARMLGYEGTLGLKLTSQTVGMPLWPQIPNEESFLRVDGTSVPCLPWFSFTLGQKSGRARVLSLPNPSTPLELRKRLEGVANATETCVLVTAPVRSREPAQGEVDTRAFVAPLFGLPDVSVPPRSPRKGDALPPISRRAGALWRTLDAMDVGAQLVPETLNIPSARMLWVDAAPPSESPRVELRLETAVSLVGSNVTVEMGPEDAPSMIVVGAHFDSHGASFAGADDNASGVACVLEAIRAVEAEATNAKRRVLFAFFDAEEWGLQGSRALVESLRRAGKTVDAMINVDAVGRVREDQVYVLGLSKHPELAKKAVEALSTQGLKPGRDIDAFGYEHGSDHWPFHRAGIPAITLWASDYATMDSLEDTPEKVDPVGVARISKALGELILRLLRE